MVWVWVSRFVNERSSSNALFTKNRSLGTILNDD
jgi:hypothetical protein